MRVFECFPRCGSFSGVGWRARQSKQGVGFLVLLGKLRWCAPASEDGGVGVVAAGVGATVANPSCSWLEDSLQLLCRAGNGRGSGHAQGGRGVVRLLPLQRWLCFVVVAVLPGFVALWPSIRYIGGAAAGLRAVGCVF